MKNKEKISATSREWQKNNRQRAYSHHKRYRDKNREILNEKARKWRTENRDTYLSNRRKKVKERKENDPAFKFSENIRALISLSFKRGALSYKKLIRTEEILGCSREEFINYILSKCPEGIGLSDFSKYGYHIDHIIPISLAKTEEDIVRLNHYTNFQPLFWRDNIRKSNKIL